MKRLNTAKRYQYFCETLNDCGMFLLECSKEEIEHRIFENLDIEFRAFLRDESLQKLLKKGYIDSTAYDLSLKLHGMLQDIFQGPLWKSECVTTAPEWLEILKLSDEIKEYQKKSSAGFYSGKVREIKMRCYEDYNAYLILFFVCIFFAFLPRFLPPNEIVATYVTVLGVVGTIMSLVLYLWNRQYAIISEGTISVKNCLTTIVTLELKNCVMVVSDLPTNFRKFRPPLYAKWICLYDRTEHLEVFTRGTSNGKRHNRLQILYNEYKYEVLLDALRNAGGEVADNVGWHKG